MCCFAGIQTSEDARFYGISAKFDKPFTNDGKTLVIQFTVKHEQEIDCGGGYVKVRQCAEHIRYTCSKMFSDYCDVVF